MDTPVAKKVVGNLLCDSIEPEYAAQLKESGVTVMETRVVWWELEKEQGIYDWSKLDAAMEKIEQAGLTVGVFPWFMHPPKWENTLVRAKCLEHGRESSIPSIWDLRFLTVYDRLYGALAERYGDRIKFLYFSIYGDFGEPQYPHDTKHYLFSSPDAHYGYWCGDDLARADYAAYLKGKYGNIEALNTAWDCTFNGWDDDLMPKLPLSENNLKCRMDFREWYIGALMTFTDKVCDVIRKHFPKVYAGFPIGTLHEGLAAGQIKSLAVKTAVKYGTLIRWTGLINEPDFGVMNLTAQRISSAVRFYSKCKFGTEAALELNDKAANHVIYANLSCGSHVLHNDLTNIQRGWERYIYWKDRMEELPVTCDAALYYPVEGEQLECMEPEQAYGKMKAAGIVANEAEGVLESALMKTLYREASALRRMCCYEVTDSLMIEDGFLYGIRDLFIASRCPIPEKAADKILAWVKSGGRLWYNEKSTPWILETGCEWKVYAETLGYAQSGKDISQIEQPEPYASIQRKHAPNGELLYSSLHGHRYSVYLPERGEIIIHDLNTL